MFAQLFVVGKLLMDGARLRLSVRQKRTGSLRIKISAFPLFDFQCLLWNRNANSQLPVRQRTNSPWRAPAPSSSFASTCGCKVTPANPGGIQTFSRFLVRALRDLYPEAEISVFSKNDSRSVRATPHLDPLLERGGEETEQSRQGAPRIVGFGRWPRALRSAAFAAGLFRHAVWPWGRTPQRGVPTIVISTHVNFAPVAALFRRISNIRFCAVGHGIEVWDIPKARLRKALRAADLLLAVSHFTRDRMASALSLNPDKIDILPNTFDSEKFRPGPKPAVLLARYGLTQDQPVILTVARLEETEKYKGYDQVLRALPAVRQRFPDVRYVLVGDGSDRTRDLEVADSRPGTEDAVDPRGLCA